MIAREYLCPGCGVCADVIEDRDSPEERRCERCGALAHRVISATSVKIPLVTAMSMGRDDPKPKGATDWRDGRPWREVKAERSKRASAERRDRLHKKLKS